MLKSLLARTEGEKGPGMREIMKIVATGGALVGMSAAAITMLVTSFVKPELTDLQGQTKVLASEYDARADTERAELVALREKRRAEVEQRLEELAKNVDGLKERFGWQAKVSK